MSAAEITQKFSEYLHKKDLKNTSERLTVLRETLNMEKHFEAESLVYHLRNKNQKISRATVYRTLDLLVDCGILNKIQFDNNTWQYEPTFDFQNHDHFKCLKCDKIIEFYDQNIYSIHANLENKFKFKISNYTHIIYGICNDCIANGKLK